MNEEDLKINFRYLTGNIACMNVDSVSGKPIHNDINNEEAIILFNSLVGEKEGCRTLKTLLKENQQLKEDYNKVVHEATEFESKVYELEEVINKAIHRIQLLQMDGEVTIRDLGLIVRDLKGENK